METVNASKHFKREVYLQPVVELIHHICPLCNQLLYQTVQTERASRACLSCYENAIKGKSKVCPIDGENGVRFFPDKFADKEVSNLKFFCMNKDRGCNWSGRFADLLNKHSKTCEYKFQACDVCGQVIDYDELQEHKKFYCPKMLTECSYCHQCVLVTKLQEHQTTACPNAPQFCAYKCGERIKDPVAHMDECAMLKNYQTCLYLPFGCEYDKKEETMQNHLSLNSLPHQFLLLKSVQQLQADKTKLLKESEQKDIMINNIRSEMEGLKGKFEEALNSMELMKNAISSNSSQCAGLLLQMQDLETCGSNAVDNEYSAKIIQLENDYSRLSTNVAEMDLNHKLLENRSYDGHFIWRVTNFEKRSADAYDGTMPAVHSAPCYTSRFGYKFCIRLYLNGDGIGKNSHISIFIVIMRSEYDDLLKWPFLNKVTFKLRGKNGRDISETFTPDRSSSSFQKPTRDMNIAAGNPKFVTKKEITSNYLFNDDSLYIETVIHQ